MVTITFEQTKRWLRNNGYWLHYLAEVEKEGKFPSPEKRFASIDNKRIDDFFRFGKHSIFGNAYWDECRSDYGKWRRRFKDDSHLAKLLRHMEEGGSVSYLNSESEFGIRRLTARICELRTRGHVILTASFRDGDGHRHTRYYMEGKR